MWSTEIIVFSTEISWQTCQLYFFTFIAINLFPHRLSAIEQTPFLLSYRLKIRPRLILYVSNSKILVRRSTRPYSLSARRSNKISSYEKRSHRLCLVYKFKCDLCDAGYVGFRRGHLHQRVQEHRNSTSSIGEHFSDKHSLAPRDLKMNFSVLKKSTNKFDCLLFETLFVQRFLISYLIFFFNLVFN